MQCFVTCVHVLVALKHVTAAVSAVEAAIKLTDYIHIIFLKPAEAEEQPRLRPLL